jgi:tetratricopeptide (TPR) repeat protein
VHSGDLKDLNKSMDSLEMAISLTHNDHPNKPGYFHNLADSLQVCFGCLGELKDMDESIDALSKAILLAPNGHSAIPLYLNSLGISLQSRFEHVGELKDVAKSIDALEKAISLTPDGHPDKRMHFHNLGISLQSQFECLGELKDLDAATLAFKSSATAYSGNPYWKIGSAKRWARLVEMEPSLAVSTYLNLIELLPKIAWFISKQSKNFLLSGPFSLMRSVKV